MSKTTRPLRCRLGLHAWRAVTIRCIRIPDNSSPNGTRTMQQTVRRCHLCETLTQRLRRVRQQPTRSPRRIR